MIADETAARDYCAQWCDTGALENLETFIGMLREENASQNLISTRSLDEVWQRHIADSLQLLAHVPRGTKPWLDLGSGAGMPGLVIAIAQPSLAMTLVESRKRRVAWLEAVKERFALDNCTIEGAKLENVENFSAGVICARAFAPLEKLLRLSTRFSTRDTHWLLPKGRSAAQELAEQPESVKRMFHVEQSLTDADAGIVVGCGRPDIR